MDVLCRRYCSITSEQITRESADDLSWAGMHIGGRVINSLPLLC